MYVMYANALSVAGTSQPVAHLSHELQCARQSLKIMVSYGNKYPGHNARPQVVEQSGQCARARKEKKKFQFLEDEQQRNTLLRFLNRSDAQEFKHVLVCAEHFPGHVINKNVKRLSLDEINEKQIKYLGEGPFLEKEHLQNLPRGIPVVTHFFR